MAWITLPTVFSGNTWLITDLNADFAAIVDALNAFNPSGSPGGPNAVYTTRGLLGDNDAVTPNTKYTMSADAVVFRNPVDGSGAVEFVVTATNDVLVAGPAVNGRDQAGAFSASSWIHFYWILNPSTGVTATVSSATPPPVGPALPSTYTMWAYAGAVRFDAGSALLKTTMRGALMSYVTQVSIVNTNATPINSETAVSVGVAIPPNAISYLLTESIILTNGATCGFVLQTRVQTGLNTATLRGSVNAAVAGSGCQQLTLPNVGQQYLYLWDVDIPAAPALVETHHDINGYRVANGDA